MGYVCFQNAIYITTTLEGLANEFYFQQTESYQTVLNMPVFPRSVSKDCPLICGSLLLIQVLRRDQSADTQQEQLVD